MLFVHYDWVYSQGVGFGVGLFTSVEDAIAGLRAATFDAVDDEPDPCGFEFFLKDAMWLEAGVAWQVLPAGRPSLFCRTFDCGEMVRLLCEAAKSAYGAPPPPRALSAGRRGRSATAAERAKDEDAVVVPGGGGGSSGGGGRTQRAGGVSASRSAKTAEWWSVEFRDGCRRPGLGTEVTLFPEPGLRRKHAVVFDCDDGDDEHSFYVLPLNRAEFFFGGCEDGSEWRRRLRMTWIAAVTAIGRAFKCT